MDLGRFIDLYVSETQEHIRLLQRSLIELEGGGGAAAVAEAFRAAHTLKGISAAMGYNDVAALAHGLEDRLDAIRSGHTKMKRAGVATLIAAADELEDAISVAVQTPPVQSGEQRTAPVSPRPAGASQIGPAPAGTATVVYVRLRADAPIKGARATMILGALTGAPGVIGSDPHVFGEDFDGEFRVFLAENADAATVEAAIRGGGEVEWVEATKVGEAPTGPERLAGRTNGSAASRTRQVRVDVRRLDGLADGLGELSVLYTRLQGSAMSARVSEVIDRVGFVLGELEHDMRALRMVPMREVFERLPRVARDAARSVGRDVELVLSGEDVEMDRSILDEISDPLTHLLRNAVDHGIENAKDRRSAGKRARGQIHVRAERERGSVSIVVEDDGRGVSAGKVAAKARAAGVYHGDDVPRTDEELFRLMSMPGLSTADRVSAVSGRGVGMDVVVNRVRALGGAIDMRTTPGTGTVFTLRLPTTLAVAQALRVRVGGEDYAIPLTHVSEAVHLDVDGGADALRVRSHTVPLVRLRKVLRVEAGGAESAAVIAGIGGRRAALAVDELVGREQILVRTFGAVTGMLPYFSGATLLADGRPALVLDPLSVL